MATTPAHSSPVPEPVLTDGWRTTGCVLCPQNCGLEVLIEDGRMSRVRPDKANPRSQGYICRKGSNVAHFQHHAERLTHPLKRTAAGFERISWERAIDEIAERLQTILAAHGPRSLALVGAGAPGNHLSAVFAVRLLRALGSRYHYSPLAQELTGMHWVMGRCLGRQYLHTAPDVERTDLLVALGWNPWMSHQMPQARRVVKRFADDPGRMLVVIDPRRTETAARADLHLAIRPGTDALLLKAMIAIILAEGRQDDAFLAAHTSGFDEVRAWFEGVDVAAALATCELDEAAVRDLCRLLTERRWSIHSDLGILMSRHSTATSYLEMILLAVCGRLGVPGGNVIPGHVMPLGSHSDERDPKTWRTLATDYPAIMGVYPPNVLPEEVRSGLPERLRAVIVSGSNPLRSYADTSAWEAAFAELELAVTVEVAMTETAAASHYVLPARTPYEGWSGTFFPVTWPGVFFQLRPPVVAAAGEALDESEIFVHLADRMGLVPAIPDELETAAAGDRMAFGAALLAYVGAHPEAAPMLPFVLARTLGRALGSADLAALWGLLATAPRRSRENAARAGFDDGAALGEELFRILLARPEGLWVGRSDEGDNLAELATPDGRVQLLIPELAAEVQRLDAASEQAELRPDPDYPLVLVAGFRTDDNANNLMRDPSWNGGRRACTLRIHADDAAALGIADGEPARVVTSAGEVVVEAQVSAAMRRGQVAIPHGFGLDFEGSTYGVPVNRLTPAGRRDPIAGTPWHRYVPCRVTKA